MDRYFCKHISSFWLDNRDVQERHEVRWRLRKETSLAPPCSNLRAFGSKCRPTVLKNWLWHCCDFLPTPRSDSAPEKLCPLNLSLRLWCYAIKIGKFSENKQIFKSERHQLLFHEHLQFSNTILGLPHRACTDWQQRLLAAFQVSSCSFCVTSDPATRVFQSGPMFVLLIIKLFPHSTSYSLRLEKFENNLWIFWRPLLLRKRPSKPG